MDYSQNRLYRGSNCCQKAALVTSLVISIVALALSAVAISLISKESKEKEFLTKQQGDNIDEASDPELSKELMKTLCPRANDGDAMNNNVPWLYKGGASAQVGLKSSIQFNQTQHISCDQDTPTADSCFVPLALNDDLDPRMEHVVNMKVSPECLTVMYPGKYHVYASVQFKPMGNDCLKTSKGPWILGFRVFKKSRIITLLLNATTTCHDESHLLDTTGYYLGGTFELKVNDTLFIEVSGIVTFEQTSSYLGAIFLYSS